MRKKIIAGNWKMNKTAAEAVEFVREVQDEGEDPEALANLVAELKDGGHKIIVPHIEQASMLPTLWQTGTDYIQGYYVQAPAEDMEFDFSLD